MWCNQIFSLLSITNEETTEYTVRNIIVCDNYEVASQIARSAYGDAAIAVDTTQYALSIGDTYNGGKFYNGSDEVKRNPTEAEKITEMTNKMTSMQNVIETQSETIEAQEQLIGELNDTVLELLMA